MFCVRLQPFEASSPEILYLVKAGLGTLGNEVVGGEMQGLPQSSQDLAARHWAENLPTYYDFRSGDTFWESRVTYMLSKTIVNELVRAHQHTLSTLLFVSYHKVRLSVKTNLGSSFILHWSGHFPIRRTQGKFLKLHEWRAFQGIMSYCALYYLR